MKVKSLLSFAVSLIIMISFVCACDVNEDAIDEGEKKQQTEEAQKQKEIAEAKKKQQEKDRKREYECGDTGYFDGYSITIKNPNKTVVIDDELFLIVPIVIKCKDVELKIGRENFLGVGEYESYVTHESEYSFPSELVIKKGDSYDGTMLVSNDSKYIFYDVDKSFFGDDYDDSKWTFNKGQLKETLQKGKEAKKKKKKALKANVRKCSSIDSIVGHEVGSMIKAKVYCFGPHKPHFSPYTEYDNIISVAFDSNGEDDFFISMKKDDYKKLKGYEEGARITIKGELAIRGYDSTDIGYVYLPLLKNTSLVS